MPLGSLEVIARETNTTVDALAADLDPQEATRIAKKPRAQPHCKKCGDPLQGHPKTYCPKDAMDKAEAVRDS